MMTRVHFLLILVCSIFFFGCTKSKSVDEFSVNRALWQSKKLTSYTFSFRLVCFCPPARVGPHVIRVVNGKIVSVNGLPYDVNKTGPLYTIDEYFDFISSTIAQKPFGINISYNPKYGYPEIVYFDFIQAAQDDDVRYAITSFEIN
jgi:hypothetical protein